MQKLQKAIFHLLVILSTTFSVIAQDQKSFELFQMDEFRIQVDEAHWHNKLKYYKSNKKETRLVAQLRINGIEYDSVGFRFKGNSSYHSVIKSGGKKIPFNIKLNEVHKKQCLPSKCKTIKLSNGFRDPSFTRDALSYHIARKYMPAPHANYAKLYINDEYIGLYTAVESVDGPFLKEHYGDSDGIFVKCDPDWRFQRPSNCKEGDKASMMYLGRDSACYMGYYEVKSDSGWDKLIKLFKTLNNEPEKIEQVFNVDQVLWMLAFNSIFVNLDSYTGRLCHNYYLYEDEFGRFNPIIWDLNLNFGGFRYDGKSNKPLSVLQMAELSPFLHLKNEKRPLISQLFKMKLYRRLYVAHLRTILNEYVFNDAYFDKAKEIRDFVAPYVREDKNGLYPIEAFDDNLNISAKAGKTSIVGLKELMDSRKAYLQDHHLLNRQSPQIVEEEHRVEGDSVYFDLILTDCTEAFFSYRFQKRAPFKRVKMEKWSEFTEDDKLHYHFKFTLEKQDKTQYYFLALNEKAATLSPERAEYEFHKLRFKE